ncbi:MAG: ABC-2 family transporter protein [Acidobacteriota bacterium]|jgi:ABC-2 type transport system permease protein
MSDGNVVVAPQRERGSFAVWVRRYAALIRNAWLIDLQYRAAIGIWTVWGLVEPTLALGIWWSIAGGGDLQGYGRADFARYFFAIMLINQLTVAWDSWTLDHWIREGQLNPRLARPMAPVHELAAENIAFKVRGALTLGFGWVVLAIAWPAVRLPFDPERWALALLAVIPAAAIRFLAQYVTGLGAFWITRATAIADLQYGLSLFLAGRIAPLELLPEGVRSLAYWTWFPYMIGFPAEVLTGRISTPGGFWGGFALSLGWLVAWCIAYRLVWTFGVRRYAAVGG